MNMEIGLNLEAGCRSMINSSIHAEINEISKDRNDVIIT